MFSNTLLIYKNRKMEREVQGVGNRVKASLDWLLACTNKAYFSKDFFLLSFLWPETVIPKVLGYSHCIKFQQWKETENMAVKSHSAGYTVLGTVIWATFFGRENLAPEYLYFSHEHNLCLVRHGEVFSDMIPTQPPVKVITKKQNNRTAWKNDSKLWRKVFL